MIQTERAEAGIAAAIIGNVLVSLALNLQRYTRRRLVHVALHGVGPIIFSEYVWVLGIGLLVAGEASNLVAYGLAPASVVSPLGVFVVISNCVIPPLMFDETPHIHTIVGTLLAMPGILLLILSAPDARADLPPLTDEKIKFLSGSLILAMTLALIRVFTPRRQCWRWLLANVSLSALMGAHCVLAVKRLAAAVNSGHDDPGIGGNAAYALIFIISGLLQVSLLADVLKDYPVWQVIPQHFAFFTAYVAVGSSVVNDEFEDVDVSRKLQFSAGLLAIVIGVWLASKPHRSSKPEARVTNVVRRKLRIHRRGRPWQYITHGDIEDQQSRLGESAEAHNETTSSADTWVTTSSTPIATTAPIPTSPLL